MELKVKGKQDGGQMLVIVSTMTIKPVIYGIQEDILLQTR